ERVRRRRRRALPRGARHEGAGRRNRLDRPRRRGRVLNPLNVLPPGDDVCGMREVLIVDDSPDLRGMLAFTLGDLGYSVRQAKNGSYSLHELADHAPDCVVLDLMMPDIDGFKVLEAMPARKLAPEARV